MKIVKHKSKLIEFLKQRRGRIFLLNAFFMLGLARMVFAVAPPAAGDFSFEIYDLIVTNVLNGPIGFVAGVGTMAAGALAAVQQKIFPGVVCIGAGTMLMNAESLVTALGATF